MKIIRNVTSNQQQADTKRYGDELHIYLNETEITDAETETITYSYDKVIVANCLQYADPIEAAIVYFNNKDKQIKLDNLIVTTESGKKFYADPISRADISDAIALSAEAGQSRISWKLKTGWETVTLEELQEARILALTAKGEIIGGVAE